MKVIARISLLSLSLCLFITPALAQKRAGKPAAKAVASGPRTLCQGDTVPTGYVVVELKRSSKCVELIIRKPATSEVVCNGSPVPEGYSFVQQTGAIRCTAANENPLTNAFEIKRDGAPDETPGPCNRKYWKIGMKSVFVLTCLGQPTSIKTLITEDGTEEVWTYTVYGSIVLARFSFEDDKLTSIYFRR